MLLTRTVLARFGGFLLIGAVNTLLSFALLFLFNELCNVHYLLSYSTAYVATVFFSYVANARAVFRARMSIAGAIGFFCAYISGLLLGFLLLWYVGKILPEVNKTILSYAITVVTTFWNFIFAGRILRNKNMNILANVKQVTFPVLGDERGHLVVQESMSDLVPFSIKRTFFIFDTSPGTIRGSHAHYRNRQMLICVSGACTIKCEKPNGEKSTYRLDSPETGLLLEGMVWHTMEEFEKDAVLLVLASEHYYEEDYIRKYSEFKRVCR